MGTVVIVVQTLSNVAVIVTAGFILWQVFVGRSALQQAIQEYRASILRRKQDLAIDYARRWNTWPDFSQRTRVTEILRQDLKAEDITIKIQGDICRLVDIAVFVRPNIESAPNINTAEIKNIDIKTRWI